MQTEFEAKPVLKWAGGKRQLLAEILREVKRLLPKGIGTYHEPFVGGAAVFFALANDRRFERARLSDQNKDLICVYRELRDDYERVVGELEKLRERGHSEETYYAVRELRPRTGAARAARLIYLNKTGYNGLYRVNRSGAFNVPFGRYKKPRILDPGRLEAAARALQGVELEVEDFQKAGISCTSIRRICRSPRRPIFPRTTRWPSGSTSTSGCRGSSSGSRSAASPRCSRTRIRPIRAGFIESFSRAR
jgi:DNA adenine methylase Dam